MVINISSWHDECIRFTKHHKLALVMFVDNLFQTILLYNVKDTFVTLVHCVNIKYSNCVVYTFTFVSVKFNNELT